MNRDITDRDIYAHAERLYSDKEVSVYKYSLSYQGEYVLDDLSAEEVRDIISCLQHALDVNKEGGTPGATGLDF